ncbi:hypothetical protein [Ahniella affigens]|nr:hypothetical protein [Ahniella affigens]
MSPDAASPPPQEPGQAMLDGLNWGALALTSFWLIRNGFLLTFLIYLGLLVMTGPFALVISLLFFVRGTKWSWGNGQRWQSFDQFADSQYIWGYIGKVSLLLQLAAIVWVISYYETIQALLALLRDSNR